METEQITIQVAPEAARLFKSVSEDERRKLEALLSFLTRFFTKRRLLKLLNMSIFAEIRRITNFWNSRSMVKSHILSVETKIYWN